MKTKYFILVLASCLATLFTSCSESWPYSEEAYDNTWIDAYPSYISLDEDELNGEFTVSSSDYWYIYSSPSWINISNTSGYGYELVTFTVDENRGNSTRYGYIKIKTSEGITKEAEVEIAQPHTVKAPFTITKVEVANVDYNSNIINNYGSTIYSYQTRFLKPRIYVSVNTPGKYTVNTKLYDSKGTLSTGTSSPTGYSFNNDITLTSTTSYVNLTGWGNSIPGNWPAGQYRWEFWYNNAKIGEKSFTIY